MPTITIKNGEKSIRFTATERRQMESVLTMLDDIESDYAPLRQSAQSAKGPLAVILGEAAVKPKSASANAAKPKQPAKPPE